MFPAGKDKPFLNSLCYDRLYTIPFPILMAKCNLGAIVFYFLLVKLPLQSQSQSKYQVCTSKTITDGCVPQGEHFFYLQIIYETVLDIYSQTLTNNRPSLQIGGIDENSENKMMVLFSFQQKKQTWINQKQNNVKEWKVRVPLLGKVSTEQQQRNMGILGAINKGKNAPAIVTVRYHLTYRCWYTWSLTG